MSEVIGMRRCLAVLACLLLGVGIGAFSIPLCEFQSPLTDLSDLVIGFSYQYHNDPFGLPDADVSRGTFLVEYVRLYDTPEFGFNVSLTNDMTIAVLGVSTYTTLADVSYKRYLVSEGNMFAFAGGSARSSSSFQSLGLSANLGVGAGRFNDVTPLAKATRIDEDLVRRGSLTSHLHPVDLEILAHEIGSVSSYASLADLISVIQEIIEDSGWVKVGGLDALDISEITRLIQDDSFSRYCGWDAKIGLGYELLDPSGGDNDLLVTGAFNYAFTTTPNFQFLIQGTVSGPPAILEQNRADVTASYEYLIAEFLTLNASYDFSRETWASVPTDIHKLALDLILEPLDTADVSLSVVLESRPYYVEWNVDVRLAISMDLL